MKITDLKVIPFRVPRQHFRDAEVLLDTSAVLAYATGYVLTRRSLPAGGAGVVEIALTFALTWFGLPFVRALLGVVLYRLFNLWLPIVPAFAVMPSVDELRRDFDEAERLAEEEEGQEADRRQ